MEKITDWSALWRLLVEIQRRSRRSESRASRGDDPWQAGARDFDARAKLRWSEADAIRDFVGSKVGPNTTILDIGAGTGRWVVFLAPLVRKVTALDPSPSMLAVLRENLAAESIENVEVVQDTWPEAAIEPHDIVLCSHAMYFSPDLPAFVNRMIEVARQACYLVVRVSTHDGVMAEAARHIWGHAHDSPNFRVAYNVLLEMGLCPNVVVDHSMWRPWTSPSLEAALADMKQRFELGDNVEHDDFLRDLLRRHLRADDGCYVWPEGVYSALIYWNVTP